MHELSIARSVLDLVAEHAPSGVVVRHVRVRAGPLRAIEPEAMQWAWRAATVGSDCQGAVLHLELRPWKMACHACGRCWEGGDPMETCRCGSQVVYPSGGDELILVSLGVEDTTTIQRTGEHGAVKISGRS